MVWFVIQFILGMLIGFTIGCAVLILCDYVYKHSRTEKK